MRPSFIPFKSKYLALFPEGVEIAPQSFLLNGCPCPEGTLSAKSTERKLLLLQKRGSDLSWWKNQDTCSDLWQIGIRTQLCDHGHLVSQPLFCGERKNNCMYSRELLEESWFLKKAETSAWFMHTGTYSQEKADLLGRLGFGPLPESDEHLFVALLIRSSFHSFIISP